MATQGLTTVIELKSPTVRFGRVEPKKTQGYLPKSCHSLNLEMENFASIISDRYRPFLPDQNYKTPRSDAVRLTDQNDADSAHSVLF
ncbi:hypothetical protein [Methylomonas sp. MgM2]